MTYFKPTVTQIANEFIMRGIAADKPMRFLQVERLCLVATGLSLVHFDAPLFHDSFEECGHTFHCRRLHDARNVAFSYDLNKNVLVCTPFPLGADRPGARKIELMEAAPDFCALDDDQRSLIDAVYRDYAGFTLDQWAVLFNSPAGLVTRVRFSACGNAVPDSLLKAFFSQNRAALPALPDLVA